VSVEAREDHRDRNREYRARRRIRVMDHGSQELDLAMNCVSEPIVHADHRVRRRGIVICVVCGAERSRIVIRERRRRARDPP
jgi:hypothetical protein